MKNKLQLLALCGAGLMFGPMPLVQSQPANPPQADAPARIELNAPQISINGRILTPEQIKQMQLQQEEQRMLSLRQRLTQSGVTDTAAQDAIVAFIKEKEAARVKLQGQWQELQELLNRADVPDNQLTGQLYKFQAAADDEKARRDKAVQDLSATIRLDDKPRVKVLLISLGIIGDEAALLRKDSALGFGAFPGMGAFPGGGAFPGFGAFPGMGAFPGFGAFPGGGTPGDTTINNESVHFQFDA